MLARCRRQEPAAQWALYQQFAMPMLAVAQRYAPSAADAEDVLQDAFIRIFERLPEQREPATFPGWVQRIVVRTAINAWHKRRLRRDDLDLDEVHHVAAPDASAIQQLTVAEVKVLIDQLPPVARLVLLLYTVDGYAHAEIAELLHISESGSKAHLSRARQRLAALVHAAGLERVAAPPPADRSPSPTPFHPLTTLLLQ